MRENARRGAQRPSPGSGRTVAHDVRPGQGNQGQAPKEADAVRLTSIIEPVLGPLNLDLEGVRVVIAGRRRVLRIIVDADGGVSLDEIAVASRELSGRLDSLNAMGDAPYTLEVSSPGVDRPLTQPRHWRRAMGRLVTVQITGGQQHSEQDRQGGPFTTQARVIGADTDVVTLEIGGTRRTFGYAELGPGRVQVEFGRLDEFDDTGDADSPGDGADEEDRDGH